MSAYCIVGTFVPDAAAAAMPGRVARSLVTYRQHVNEQLETEICAVARYGADVDWAALWQDFSQLILKEFPVLLAYNGSLGDAITPETTAANWARDWQMPLLLLVPIDDGSLAIAQTTAFVGLARHAQAKVAGVILWGVEKPDEAALIEIREQLQVLTQVPVIGFWLEQWLDGGDREALARAVADFDWERLGL